MAEVGWSVLILITLWTVDRQSINTRFHQGRKLILSSPIAVEALTIFLDMNLLIKFHLYLVHTSLFKICCHLFQLLVFKKKKTAWKMLEGLQFANISKPPVK